MSRLAFPIVRRQPGRWPAGLVWPLACLMLWAWAAPGADARTVVLDGEAIVQVAGLDEAAPHQSWALHESWTGTMTNSHVVLSQRRVMLLKVDLSMIPSNRRIANAELFVPTTARAGNEPRMYLWRVVAPWGPGVSYLNRMTLPTPTPWARPGAAGISSDRATRPTDVISLAEMTEPTTINVTEDIALWHSGRADNHGWAFTVEDPGVTVTIRSPIWESPDHWRLRITYEPDPASTD